MLWPLNKASRTMSFRQRLILFCILIAFFSGYICWSMRHVLLQTKALNQTITRITLQDAPIANRFKDGVHQLNTDFWHFLVSGDERYWTKYEDDSNVFSLWLSQQRKAEPSPVEREKIALVEKALATYLASAAEILHQREVSHTITASALERRDTALTELLNFAANLAWEREQELANVGRDARTVLTRVQTQLYTSLGCLALLGLAMAAMIYRDALAPLRKQVISQKKILAKQEKLAALGELAAGLAHEIRNPLMALKARLFILQKRATTSAENDDLDVIEGEIDRLEIIVKEFLGFARPPLPHPAPVDVREVLESVINLFQHDCADKGIQIRINNQDCPSAMADAMQIKQVLINLVRNAIDAMPAGGMIRLECGELDDKSDSHKRFVLLAVEDDGTGIPLEIQPRLFDPFFTTKANGTGLGLALSAQLIERQEGHLRFQNTPGQGTRFEILLPAVTAMPTL